MAGKILVAEDDPEARGLLKLLLSGGEYELIEAADGMEALERARAELPDLVITDIVMPRMDGYELVRRLRQDDSTARTPVIFCSASYHEREVREMARSLGVQSTLAKPYDITVVRAMVDAALAARAGTQPPSALAAAPLHGGAQERLSALVAFSRRVFGHTDPAAIVESTCHSARDILLAQCAQLVIADGDGQRYAHTTSGLPNEQVDRLLSTQMYRDLLQSLETGGCALYPMSPDETARPAVLDQPGDFHSMLGVPVASVTRYYGYM
ncbi:MAG: response regulator, partial [Steroidobacteraceae bacterium]